MGWEFAQFYCIPPPPLLRSANPEWFVDPLAKATKRSLTRCRAPSPEKKNPLTYILGRKPTPKSRGPSQHYPKDTGYHPKLGKGMFNTAQMYLFITIPPKSQTESDFSRTVLLKTTKRGEIQNILSTKTPLPSSPKIKRYTLFAVVQPNKTV